MRVVTLNLWNINPPLAERMQRIETFLHTVQPDVVAMQEVSMIAGVPQSERLAAAADLALHRFDLAGDWDGRPEGLALAVRGGTLNVSSHELPVAQGDGRRICQLAELEIDGRRWRVCNVHLAYHADAGAARRRQLDVLLGLLFEPGDGCSTILMGDLNDVPSAPALAPLRASPLQDVWAAVGAEAPLTFARANPWVDESLWPDRTIDYILTTPDVRVNQVSLGMTDPACVGSDHYAVVADVA